MSANGKKMGLRVAVLFAVAGATMAMAGAPSSEGVAMDQVVMVNKDAPQQSGHGGSGGSGGGGHNGGGGSDRGGIFNGGIFGGGILGAIIFGNITGEDSIVGNNEGNVVGNSNGNHSGH